MGKTPQSQAQMDPRSRGQVDRQVFAVHGDLLCRSIAVIFNRNLGKLVLAKSAGL